MKNILLALTLSTLALGSFTPAVFAEPGVPAVFSKERQPMAEEFAEGTPLAVIFNQIKAIKADAEAVKANPKSTEKLDAIWATMTPDKKKDFTYFGLTDIRRDAIHQSLKKANLDPKTMKINVLVSEGGFIVIGLLYKELPEGGGKFNFVMKKTDKGWLNCTLEEMPDELVAKTKWKKRNLSK